MATSAAYDSASANLYCIAASFALLCAALADCATSLSSAGRSCASRAFSSSGPPGPLANMRSNKNPYILLLFYREAKLDKMMFQVTDVVDHHEFERHRIVVSDPHAGRET